MTHNLTVSIWWEGTRDRRGRFTRHYREFRVQGSVEGTIPARIRADPNDCWPAEGGEVEITGVWESLDDRDVKVDPQVLEDLGLTEAAEERLFEEAPDAAAAAWDDECDRRYDEWKDGVR